MNLLYKYNPQVANPDEVGKGCYTSIVKRGESNIKYIDFGLLKFSGADYWEESVTDEEVALILISGECNLKIAHDSSEINQTIGPRPNVFREKAYGAYIPKDSKYEIRTEGPAEIAVCKVPSEIDAEPAIITPEKVKVKVVGQAVHEVTAERSEHNWKRQVHDIIDADVKAQHLVIGETFNSPGNWSSSPPH